MAYQYLYEPEIQYQTKDGRNNTAGFLRVYLAATDDPATTYSDFGGTRNPQDIVLDDDGRAVVIVDDSKAYRLEVYDREGMLLFTCQPITAVGGGSGSASIVQVVSTDGTVSVTKTTAAGITTYDLSTAFEPEAARWARRTGTSESVTGDEDWHELDTFAEIGSTSYFNGWKLSKDCAYDLAASMEMPAGYDGAINTISVKFVVEKDGVLQDVQFGHVDPTANMDRVSFEFKGAGLAGEKINARLFYRTRQDMPIALESEVFYNEEADSITGGGGLGDLTAGDYIEITEDHVINATGIQPEITWSYDNTTISAINGSAVGRRYDGIYPIVVDNNQNTVAVDHTGLAVDETMTAYNSADHIVIGVASGQFQPSGSYLSSNALDGISGAWNEVSAKLDQSASGQFYPSSNPSGFLTAHQSLAGYATEAYVDSSVSSKLDTTAFSTVSGDFLTSHQSLAGYATESYVDSAVSGKLDVTASSQFLTSLPDDLAYTSDVASAVSGKMDKSESSSFYPMDSNPSGYLTAHQSLAGYATETYVDSAVSGKLDATAYDSAEFYPSSNPSGFITGVDLSDYQEKSAMTAYQPSGDYAYNSSLSGYIPTSESSKYVTSLAGYATEAYVDSSVSGKLDVTAQVVTATATQLYAGTAYVTAINGALVSASRAGNAANASMANSAYYDGTGRLISSLPDSAAVSSIASTYAESAVSGKQDTLTFDWDADSAISSINGSALAGGGAQVVTSITTGRYGVRAINGMNINASHMVFGAAASNGGTDNIQLGDMQAGVFITGSFGTAYYKVNELKLNRDGTGGIAFNIGGAGSQITATSYAGGKFSAGGTGGNRSYYTAYNASASASLEVTGESAMVNLSDTGYTSTIYPSSIPYWNAKVDQSAYDDLYSAFTALSGVISTYSAYFSSISAKVDNSAIGVIE